MHKKTLSSFSFSGKEKITLILASALALASLRADDSFVIWPMLTVASVCVLVVFYQHKGRRFLRVAGAALCLCVFGLVGWRALRPASETGAPGANRSQQIEQKAKDSQCSDVIAGRDATLNCTEDMNDKGKR